MCYKNPYIYLSLHLFKYLHIEERSSVWYWLPLPLNDAVQEREWGVLEVEGWAAAEAAAELWADTNV